MSDLQISEFNGNIERPNKVKLIKLTNGLFSKVDDEDFQFLSRFEWKAHFTGDLWYARAFIDGHHIRMHKLLCPGGWHIDHENGDSLDNQKHNLRKATQSQNMQNQGKRRGGTSKFKGVCWDNKLKGWRAQICLNYKTRYIGTFKQEADAARAYNSQAEKLFGKYARLNII